MDQQFKNHVYEITRLIPEGRVTTYGSIAKALGFPNHSRHVGKVMGDCPTDVPAHRVVGACGKLSVSAFKIKLQKEGIELNDFKIKNFKKIFWNPLEEL